MFFVVVLTNKNNSLHNETTLPHWFEPAVEDPPPSFNAEPPPEDTLHVPRAVSTFFSTTWDTLQWYMSHLCARHTFFCVRVDIHDFLFAKKQLKVWWLLHIITIWLYIWSFGDNTVIPFYMLIYTHVHLYQLQKSLRKFQQAPAYPRPSTRFMKEILSYLYFGAPGVCSTGLLEFS